MFVEGDQTPQEESGLIRAEAVFKFETPTSTTLKGRWEWSGGFLDLLNGRVQPGVGGATSSFEIVGTGRPNTDTAGWEYRYHGHLPRQRPTRDDQRPTLVGSVFRAKSHGHSKAGEVFSFIAVKQPDSSI
jgi:hypothetical protein